MYYSFIVIKKNIDTVHYNNKTSAKAESLFKLIDDFEFILTLVAACSDLDDVLPAIHKIRAKDLYVAQSMDLLQNIKLTIESLRNSVENYHENWYNKAKNLREKVNIAQANMTKPRICFRQLYQ